MTTLDPFTTPRAQDPFTIPRSMSQTSDIIDDDIQHTVGSLLLVRPQKNNFTEGKPKESLEDLLGKTIQAERNHWKDRLHSAMQEIDRQHRILLITQSALQGLNKGLCISLRRGNIIEEEDDDDQAELDQGYMMNRLIDQLKFNIRQLKVKAGVTDISVAEYNELRNKRRESMTLVQEKLSKLQWENEEMQNEMENRDQKIIWLQGEMDSLRRQLHKLQQIIKRYNENHSGSNFHLNIVESPQNINHKDPNVSPVRERTYIEGDLQSYLIPGEEMDMWKERIRKQIFSARKGTIRTGVAQCLRCQKLFKPSENTNKACRFHHKGREIKEQYDENGKLDKVLYKWACCKKTLDMPGCMYGYHV